VADDGQVPARPKRLADLPRARRGLPLPAVAEPAWSEDLFTPTTTDMGAGNPRNGVSPWPAEIF
jgi:hypothetical protein